MTSIGVKLSVGCAVGIPHNLWLLPSFSVVLASQTKAYYNVVPPISFLTVYHTQFLTFIPSSAHLKAVGNVSRWILTCVRTYASTPETVPTCVLSMAATSASLSRRT